MAYADPTGKPGITVENYRDLLDHVFDVYTGKYVIAPVNAAVDVLLSATVQESVEEQDLIMETLSCNREGSAQTTRVNFASTNIPMDYRISYRSCDEAEFQFDGDARGAVSRSDDQLVVFASERIEWLDGEGLEYRMSGSTERTLATRDGFEICKWDEIFVNLHQSTSGLDDILLANFGSTVEITKPQDPTIKISGSFTIVLPVTRGHALFANAAEFAITKSEPGAEPLFTSGELSLSTRDVSRLSVSTDENNESKIIIDNSLARFEIRDPWTSFRSELPGAINELCPNWST